MGSPAISLSRAHRRSASRRELANTMVERCARDQRWTSRRSTAGHTLVRSSGEAAEGPIAGLARRGEVLDRDDHRELQPLLARRLDHGDRAARRRGRWRPPRPGGPWPTGRCAARAVPGAHRGAPATAPGASRAWSRRPSGPRRRSRSRRERRASRACDVRSRNSDSGRGDQDVRGMLANRRRSSAGVSPVRTETSTTGSGRPIRWAAPRIPTSGERRLRSMSTARAFSGET